MVQSRNPLLQQDLFHYVLDCLLPPGQPLISALKSRAMLPILARTCRVMSEPSLDRLWSRLVSLEPLIRSFATELNERSAKTPPTSNEWAVVCRYSHRVRSLKVGPTDRFSLLFLEATSSQPSPLLPNLRVLDWQPCMRGYQSPSTTAIQQLLNASLVSLKVYFMDPDDAAVQSFLTSHPFLCSNLKSVSIDLEGREDVSLTTIQVLSQAITLHQHLETLHLSNPVSVAALVHIVTSPKLRNVSLVLHPEESEFSIPLGATPFRNVEDLSLEALDLQFVTSLLQAQDQMFRSFTLRRLSQPTNDAVLALFTALASRQRVHSLCSVTLQPDPPDIESEHFTLANLDAAPVTYHTFLPLASLCHLCRLIVDPGPSFSLDDDDLASLACNWPSLQVLCLNCTKPTYRYPWRSSKFITFKGLLSLLKCCPDLYELTLPLDARRIPIYTGDVVCNPALKDLTLPLSPISDAHSVQDIIMRHFPSVTAVYDLFDELLDAEDGEFEPYMKLWSKVNVYLQNAHCSRSIASTS